MSAGAIPTLIDAAQLHTHYGASHILHGASLSIGAGEAVGLLGRNGMGKTTLIRTLLGLVRHLGEVEQGWFRRTMAGEDPSALFRTSEDVDAAFTSASPHPGAVQHAWRVWRQEVAFAERFVARAAHLDVLGDHHGEPVSLREVLVHMVEEYARHNGHADLIREAIDGATGE